MDGFDAAARLVHGIAFGFQGSGQTAAHRLVVIHNQHVVLARSGSACLRLGNGLFRDRCNCFKIHEK